MILLDADVLLIDLRYPRDPRFPRNRQALAQLRSDGINRGITSPALLEVVGILSFNVAPAHVPRLPAQLIAQNAKHFAGKVVIPVLTPEEWLNQRTAPTP